MSGDEKWLPVVGWEGIYEVSDMGRVKSLSRVIPDSRCGQRRVPERIMKGQTALPLPYVRVTLSDKQSGRKGLTAPGVHQLVAAAFLGPPPTGHEVCHGNGDPTDNRLANLRYGTRKENHADRILHGTNLAGQANPASKLTEVEVLGIRSRAASGETCASIARSLGVTGACIQQVVTRTTWRHVGELDAAMSDSE